MLQYSLKRLLQGLVTVWFIATATFFAMHFVPGDPLTSDKAVTPEIRANLEAKYGLDKPLFTQYTIYLGNIVRGDFGISFTQKNREVNDIIREHFPVSATLGLLAILFAALGGVLWGALTALFRNRLPDIIIMFLVILGISVPSFVMAALAQLSLVNINALFGVTLLPVGGWGTVAHMIAPSLVLGLGTMAYLTRLMRSSMLEIVCQPPASSANISCVMHRSRSSPYSGLPSLQSPPVVLWLNWSSQFPDWVGTSCRPFSNSTTPSSWAPPCSMVPSWCSW
jgi:ABC-type dipeptide/oligopeptide/nickel transport system permease component